MLHLPITLPLKMSGESDEIEKLKSKIEALKDFKARAVPAIKTAHEVCHAAVHGKTECSLI